MTLGTASPDGGDWGDPIAREAARVLLDIRDGVVRREAGKTVYGVVLSDDGTSLDSKATVARCAEQSNQGEL